MSAWWAAASPGCRPRFTSPSVGYTVRLLEAHRVGWGASGRNGGQVGSGQRQDQIWLEKTAGREAAHALWDIAEASKALVKTLIAEHAMPVTFHPGIAHACWRDAEVRELRAPCREAGPRLRL